MACLRDGDGRTEERVVLLVYRVREGLWIGWFGVACGKSAGLWLVDDSDSLMAGGGQG